MRDAPLVIACDVPAVRSLAAALTGEPARPGLEKGPGRLGVVLRWGARRDARWRGARRSAVRPGSGGC